jgi:hypothetical protein
MLRKHLQKEIRGASADPDSPPPAAEWSIAQVMTQLLINAE